MAQATEGGIFSTARPAANPRPIPTQDQGARRPCPAHRGWRSSSSNAYPCTWPKRPATRSWSSTPRSCSAGRRNCHPPGMPTGNGPSGVVVDAATDMLYLANYVLLHGGCLRPSPLPCPAHLRLRRRCRADPGSGRPDRHSARWADHTAYVGATQPGVGDRHCGLQRIDPGRLDGTGRHDRGGADPAVPVPGPRDRHPRRCHGLEKTRRLPNAVAVIDLRLCNAATTSGCGASPVTGRVGGGALFALADPRTRTLYVRTPFDQTVSVLDQSTCSARNTSGCANSVVAAVPTKSIRRTWFSTGAAGRCTSETALLMSSRRVDVRRCNAPARPGAPAGRRRWRPMADRSTCSSARRLCTFPHGWTAT